MGNTIYNLLTGIFMFLGKYLLEKNLYSLPYGNLKHLKL